MTPDTEVYTRIVRETVEAKVDKDIYWRSRGRRWRKREADPLWSEVQRILLDGWDRDLDDLPERVFIVEVKPWKGVLTCHPEGDESVHMLWEIGIFEAFYEPDPQSSWERISEG